MVRVEMVRQGVRASERRSSVILRLRDRAYTRWMLPAPVEKLWRDLETVRADVLQEVGGLSQAQADWKPGEKDWSVGEIVHHLVMAEIATGKLTTKLTREAATAGTLKPLPADLREFPRMSASP